MADSDGTPTGAGCFDRHPDFVVALPGAQEPAFGTLPDPLGFAQFRRLVCDTVLPRLLQALAVPVLRQGL
jgi:hypothetical protein